MPSEISIPKALYQANIDLALRIAALLQENGKQWFDLFSEEAEVCMDERMVQADELSRDLSLERLAALPSDAFAHFMGTDLERWQAVLAHVVDNQSHFSNGLQAALLDWQNACNQAIGQVAGVALPGAMSAALPGAPGLPGLPNLPGLGEILGAFQQMMEQVLPGVERPFAPAGKTQGAPARPAAPAPRKAASRSTAAAKRKPAKSASKAASKRASTSPGKRAASKSTAKSTAKVTRKAAPKRAPSARKQPAVSAPKPLPGAPKSRAAGRRGKRA